MDFGPHAADVLDFADFVILGGIFRDPRPHLGQDLEIIRSMAEVRNYIHASSEVPEGHRWDWTELLDSGGEPRTLIASYRHDDFLVANPDLMANLGGLMDGPIGDALDQSLSGGYTETDILFIWGTIEFILNYRASHGRTLPFIERLVDIYRLGGHPCGWVGAFPIGRVVAYFPEPTARERHSIMRSEEDG